MSELYSFDKYKGVKIFVEVHNGTYYGVGEVNGTTLYEAQGGSGSLVLNRIKDQIDKASGYEEEV